LHDALLAHLRNAQANAAQERARTDLESGLFLPGRGLLDMKAGLAVALALAEQHATTPDRHGNLLVLAVPDEEANSAGARQAAASLPAIAGEYGLELCAAINLDSIADDGDGSRGRSVAMGSVGKLLPVALVVGRATHACYPLAGINAGALAGAIAAAMEWSPDLAARHAEAPVVPPTLLAIKDGKSQYDVTTPEQAFAYWNVLTYGRSPQSILETFRAHCERVCAEVMRRLAVVAGATDGAGAPDVRVLDVAELRALAAARTPRIEAELATALASAGALPIPEQCRIAMTKLWQASGLAGPAVITGFGSIPYLPVSLGTGVQARRLAAAVTAATADVGRRHGTRITETTFFPGISDVSFLGEADTASVPVIAANTAAWGHAFRWPERNATAGIPTINAGPWGRDYHTPLERLHVPYAFVVLPELVAEIVTSLLDGD
jgi:arginine utilization protein RocB